LTWPHRVEKYGLEEAIAITRFENKHRSSLVALAEEYGLNCELREVETVDAYFDQSTLDAGIAAAKAISEYVPELRYDLYSAGESKKQFRVSGDCVGAIVYDAAQLSSYKLVTQIFEVLVNEGINLQTETLVTKIDRPCDKSGWIVQTPRGSILARNIVHATNGYAQYLLPPFDPLIKPTRGIMTAQLPSKSLSDPPLDRTYSFIYGSGEKFDYLIQQPPYDGNKLMLGGGLHQDPQPNTFDDGDVPISLQSYLFNQLPKVLHWDNEGDVHRRLSMCWCGIMGFSKDELPWVGAVPENLGGGQGQWICAGYTGDGTSSTCLSDVRNDECVTLCGCGCDDGSW